MEPKFSFSPYLLAALLGGLAFSSCSKVNDMHDATMAMSGTTAKMAATTAEMNANTEVMKGKTDDMDSVMASIYDSGRQGAAIDVRNKQWRALVDAKKLDDKAVNAALYFQEFEFQLWGSSGRDNLKNERDALLKDAACEFFGRLLGITHWSADELDPFAGAAPVILQNPLRQPDLDNEKATFNALAFSLESVNRQEGLLDKADGEVTMLTLVETALTDGQQIRQGKAKLEDFPDYVNLVLQQEELATRLLKARHQMMAVGMLCQVTTICRDVEEGAKFTKFGVKWTIDFKQLNVAETKLVSFRLGEAIAARNFLAGLGIQSTLDPGIASVYSHGSVANAPSPSAAASDELAQTQLTVMKQLQDLTK